MADNGLDTSALGALRSSEQQNLLDEIDNLRLQGISEFVFLPQIVVCGDQSSGKSSVLEAISGVPFPKNDTVCTRFATEVILREAATPSAEVSIVPSQDVSDAERERLSAFKKTLQRLEEIPELVEQAKSEMGIRATGNGYSKNILRVEISGLRKYSLTIVDLPGLIHTDSKQQSAADVSLVSSLVTSYMKNPRSIILAVVSAKNDYANQIILKRAREVDFQGMRTLGLITKPDELPAGSDSEADFIDLASNNNIHFRLGWHVVKNRDYKSRNCSTEERDLSESQFFSEGVWKDMPRDMVGIEALRQRLSKILLDQIRTHLPNLIKDIEKSIEDCETKLKRLGDSRSTAEDQRQFLLHLSQKFQTICKAAIDGSYDDPFFGDPDSLEYRKRLRAVVQNQNMRFSRNMRINGHRRIIASEPDGDFIPSRGQTVMSRSEAVSWVRRILTRSRGRELPGSFNPLLVGELFMDQSTLWEGISREHVKKISIESKIFLESLVMTIADEKTSQALLSHWVDPRTNTRFKKATSSLSRLLVDRERHPITYNHYYTETLQAMREAQQSEELAAGMRKYLNVSGDSAYNIESITALAKSLSAKKESDMDEFACSELLDSMQAYYKVALKTFIDNVCIQVVESDLIGDLWSIFTPADVGKMSPAFISQIASESTESQALRQQLCRKLQTLQKGLEICQRHSLHRNTFERQDADSDTASVSELSDEPPPDIEFLPVEAEASGPPTSPLQPVPEDGAQNFWRTFGGPSGKDAPWLKSKKDKKRRKAGN